MISYLRRIFVVCTVGFGATASAQDVILSAPDKKLEIKGRLLHFDGTDYRIQTEFGALTVRGKDMVCTGWDCPKQDQLIEQFAFVGDGDLITKLMPALIQKHAVTLGRMAIGNPVSKTQTTMHMQNLDLETYAKVDLADNNHVVDTLDPIYLGDPPADDLVDFHQTIIARGALLPVLHPDNTVENLSVTDLSSIISGDITNWDELGGSDQPISIYVPRDLADHPYQTTSPFGPDALDLAIRLKDDQAVEARVSERIGALGIIRYHHLTNSPITPISTSCSRPVLPSVFNIQSGSYPLSFDYKMYMPLKRLGAHQGEFIRWLKTADAHRIMADNRYIGLWPKNRDIEEDSQRFINAIQYLNDQNSTNILKSMVSDLGGATRLSTTYRFDEAGDRLDATSVAYASMLQDAISDGAFEGKTLIFAGFTDNRQANGAAIAAGLKRAHLVMQQVFDTPYIEDLNENISRATSYGSVAPIACNDTPEDRAKNWRVEVWVTDR